MAMELPLRLNNTSVFGQVFTPVNVAILASLGIHGFVLGLALPRWQWPTPSETNFEDRATVGVIELTPAEQSRLPSTEVLPNNNPLASLFPNTTPEAQNPATPTDPNLPIPPDSNYNYQLPTASTIPPPPALPNLPAYPNLPPLTSYGNLSRLPITNPPIPSLPQLPSSSTSRIPRPPMGLPPAPGQFSNPIPPGINRPNFGTLPPPQGTDFITRAPQNNQDNAPPQEPGLLAQGEDTPDDQAQINSLNSIARQGVAIKAKASIAGPYPPIACRNRTEAAVVYNVFPGGQKDLIRSSRYPIFNQLAAQAIAGQSYAAPTQVTVSFSFDPRVCAGMNQFTPPSTSPMPPSGVPSPERMPSTPTLPTTPAAPGEPDTPSSPSGEIPAQPRLPVPTGSPTGRPTITPAPGINPSPQPAPLEVTPQPEAPNPAPTVSPAPLNDAPVPRPETTEQRTSPVRTTVTPAPSALPAPVAPPAPAPASPKPAVPKTKGDLLREQNQAPSITPPPAPEPPPAEPSTESSLPAPAQAKKE